MGETVLGNRYEIIRKIGDGGMAFVYEAKDKLLNRTVAVKVLRPEFVDDDEFLAKFKREAEAVASLSHQNIVNVYDVGQDGKVHYIVMEYVDGQNLKEIIKNEGTLDEYTALDITKQIAMALGAAHRKGIIHRDIKPHNILISNDGRIVKVADFGIAKAVSNSTMTNIGSIIGSVHYFSPEQAKGKFVSNNADLYSLGIVLYEMLIGKVPFRGDSPISIALQHINDEIEFTQEEKIRIPQSVRTIIKKLTEKSTANRYQSAEELIEDIEYIEKNIDLDFIKEYDNYATMKFEDREINKAIKPSLTSRDLNEHKKEELIYEDDIDVESRRESRTKQKDSNKAKKKLKIAAIALSSILVIYIAIGIFMFKGKSNNGGELVAPNLQTKSLDEAQREIEKLGLTSIVRDEYNANVEKGYVISQTPLPGYGVKEGDTITIIVSKGAKRADVPKIVGYTLEEAENILKDNKLNLGNIKYEHSDMYKSGVVLRQSPESGSSSIEEGDKIDVVVSQGPEVATPSVDESVQPTPDSQPQVNTPSNEHGIGNDSSNLGDSNTTNNGLDNSDSQSNNSGQVDNQQNNDNNQGAGDTSGSGEVSGISDVEPDNQVQE